MNIGEANAVNIVVAVLLDDDIQAMVGDDSELRDASILLVAKANAALGAGLRPADIEREWSA